MFPALHRDRFIQFDFQLLKCVTLLREGERNGRLFENLLPVT